MAQYMGPVGIFLGISIGFLTRDNYTFPMDEKLDLMR